MKISYRTLPTIWLTVVLVFTAASAVWFGYLWVNSGGRIPFLTAAGYRVSFPTKDADNLVYFNDVRMAGVKVGKVVEVVNEPAVGTLTIELDPRVAPLHEGVALRIGAKSLVEESYIEVKDGRGRALPSGTALPASVVTNSVQLDQVLNSLGPQTRVALSSTLRAVARSTAGRGGEINELFEGLGHAGRGGRTALDALAAQSAQLRSLSADTTTLLAALDTQHGQIAQLVDTGQQLTNATSQGRGDLEASMRVLPAVLESTATASDSLDVLAGALAPVARDVKAASPALSSALVRLPNTSAQLRALLPPLDDVLGEAPDTLRRVSDLRADTGTLVPPTSKILSDLNPMIAYLQPYGHDIAALFTNFGSAASKGNSAGNWAHVTVVESEQVYRGLPVSTNIGPFNRANPYPAPGGSRDPVPYEGTYPRLHRDGG